ncbi:hypothetical protein [Bacillus sp. AFS055030]|uniref:hypothetical protein n=1 Tax=Bacillus sp. AFS055030 TaxID=2033507 RepID=UPI000BFBCAE8|nr:hypothetical protein [Bacillus sp. AFS055030]PGL72073.1 hypothetical protein CN925_05890 [Bacillus sp. AFS055030]
MKLKQKLSVALLAGLVAVGPMTSKTFAAEVNPTTTQEEIQQQVSDYFAENPDFLSYATDDELANLPPDAPVVEFGSFEEFKQTMDQFQTDVHSYESAMEFEPENIITEAEAPGTVSVYPNIIGEGDKVAIKEIVWHPRDDFGFWMDPIEETLLPWKMYMDINYSYTGSGSTKKFTKINGVKSGDTDILSISSWQQTDKVTSFYDSNRGVKATIYGDRICQASIFGVPVGFRYHEHFTKKYHFS